MNFDDDNNNYNKDIMLLLLSFWCAFHGRLINLKKIKNVLSVLSVAEAKSNIIKSSNCNWESSSVVFVNRWGFSCLQFRVRPIFYVCFVISVVFYLFIRLSGCSIDPVNSHDTHKLTRTSQVIKKKKKV
jgi:hypothetical protein